MLAWRAGRKVQQAHRLCMFDPIQRARIYELSAAPELGSTGIRHASPQPVPCEHQGEKLTSKFLNGPCQNSSSHPYREVIGKWDRFVYSLYHLRARASTAAAGCTGVASSAHTEHLTSLLPVSLLLDPQARGQYPLSEWLRQLEKELDSQASTREKLERKVEEVLRNGLLLDLKSSQNTIRVLQGPLTDAIIREQRAVLRGDKQLDARQYGPYLLLAPAHVLAHIAIHRILFNSLVTDNHGVAILTKTALEIGQAIKQHVQSELQKAKARRLKAQHSKLQKKLKDVAQVGSFQEWIQEFGIPHDQHFHNFEFDQKMLENCLALKAHDLPDPADWNTAEPVSDVAIVAYPSQDPQQEPDKESSHTEWDMHGILDVVEARLKRLSQQHEREEYSFSQRRRVADLQERLNRMLEAAKHWTKEKEAKVGCRLIDIAMQALHVKVWNRQTGRLEAEPFIQHGSVRLDRGSTAFPLNKRMGVLRLHDSMIARLHKFSDLLYLQNTVYDPMVVPPLPWRGLYSGGYLLQSDAMVRIKSAAVQMEKVAEADAEGGLSKVYHSLNCLQAVPWRVNKAVLDVVKALCQRKEIVCGLPPQRPLPLILPKKRPRFITWSAGTQPQDHKSRYSEQKKAERYRKYAEAEDALLDAVSDSGSLTPSPYAHSKLAPATAVGAVANLEANWQQGGKDGRGGASMWRADSQGKKKPFFRKQLLVTSYTGETRTELNRRRFQNSEIRKQNRANFSQLCDLKIKLAVAESYKDEKAIFFPHNLDFRGRAYTLHPHLNHLGSDLCRGMLQFAEGRPLGENGLDWLLVQLANDWGQGVDKLNFEGRRQFVLDNMFEVLESAREPLEHRWWQQAEDPLQCLAVAQDIAAAIASGDPATYVSRTPVQMDGSCNGLQHYAALGLDLEGGASVNLVKADRPQDVYTEVVGLVKQAAKLDAESGSKVAQAVLPYLNRSLVKQTVMTSVYGVTLLGAKDQIQVKLRDRGYNRNALSNAGMYAAQNTLSGLNQRFKEAMRVMAWLNVCAKSVARSSQLVSWETPLGLPVVQPYRKLPTLHVQTTLQRVILQNDVKVAKVNKSKQRSAFPPNFIHSMDSTHMLMTAAACADAGMRFAGVHDSFWTYAHDVPRLNQLLREQFVALYSQPILENLKESFEEAHPDVAFPDVPEKGSLHLADVLDATYFFN